MADLDGRFWALAAAILIDALIGEPEALWRRVPHPVTLIGAAIDWLDRRFNREGDDAARRGQAGTLAALAILAGGAIAGGVLAAIVAALPFPALLEALAVAVFLAGRGLFDHVGAVVAGLERDGLAGGREAIRHIVGRDPESLDEAGVARAGVESLAENFADGVVAPAFWYLVFGLPGLVAAKAINTADSMIGHRNSRYEDFGRAAARLDDAMNWLPARLAGYLIAAAAWAGGRDWRAALGAMKADAQRHRSVNAGWPEAAMAGALGLALAGPRRYGGALVDDAVMNRGGRREAGPADLRVALRLYLLANAILWGLVVALRILA